MGFLGDLGLQVVGGAVNSIGSNIAAQEAFERQKKLMDYQWKNYTSPKAQVSNLAAAGINPAVAMGNQSPVFSSAPNPGAFVPAQYGIGTTSLTDLSQYLLAKAQAKKADVETKNIDVETEAKKFELELSKWFSAPEKVANITLAWKNVMLKDDEHNINEWKKATEEALSQLKGIERDSAKKLFENMDTVIQQENKQREENIKLTQEKQKTEGSQQSANRAAASASSASAKLSMSQVDINKELKEIRHIEREVAETGKLDQIDSLLSRYRADKMISDKEYEQARKLYESAKLFNEKGDKSRAVRFMYAMFDLLGEEIGNLSPIKPK